MATKEELAATVERLDVPDSLALVQYVMSLEQRLGDLEQRHERALERLAARITKLGG